MSCLFSRALVEEYSAGTCLDGAQFALLNVMSTPHKFWHSDKTMEFSSLSRFGLTLNLLTEDHGEELLTSFLAASLVRASPQPVEVQESMAQSHRYAHKWQESSMKFDPLTLTWKIQLCLLEKDLPESSVILPKLGSTADGVVFQQKNVVRLISEIVSGWLGETFATPQARDYRSGSLSRWNNPGRSRNLNDQVGDLLNPPWEEWLMGGPTVWTVLQSLEMDKFREWQQQHSIF